MITEEARFHSPHDQRWQPGYSVGATYHVDDGLKVVGGRRAFVAAPDHFAAS
jgi:hypothetical protein